MRVCYFGTYRAEYSRNQIMIEGLRRAGVEVIECHETLWHGIEDRVQATSGGWIRPAFLWRVLRTYGHLLAKYLKTGPYDIIVVGYPGQFDVYLARLLTLLPRKPLAWDIFMSIYLIALERKLDQKSSLTLKLLGWVEKIACALPDLLIIDTTEYRDWFNQNHHIPARRFSLVPTGADNRVFQPQPAMRYTGDLFRVLYYGSFIPNHGVPFIVEAARLLQGDDRIHFEFVGDGPDWAAVLSLVDRYGLKNITLRDWLAQGDLVQCIAQSDICLGAFGNTPQSLMTVQNKIYEGLAMAKPVITGDSPAIRGSFIHGKHLYCCSRENPRDLAEAIRTLQNDSVLRQTLADNGYDIYREHFTIEKLGQLFEEHLCKLLP